MLRGKLYGVGVGPGDKELITLKALRVLREADIIASPVTKGGGRAAFDIIKDHVCGKEIIDFFMPMSRDYEELDRNYKEIADKIEELLSEGKNIAFITLGDVTIYSTYMRIDRLINERGFETELIPGIPSFCAAAARLDISLCERDEPLVILPAGCGTADELADMYGTKVYMKAGRGAAELVDTLREKGKLGDTVMVERCGMENERIIRDLNGFNENSSYFSLFIVK